MRISKFKILPLISLSLLLAGMINIMPASADDGKDGKSEPAIYSGTYKGKQVIPNTMAIFCQANGPVMVGDEKASIGGKEVSGVTAIKACLRKILEKMKNADPQTRDEGIKDWQTITQEQVDQVMSESIAKGAVVENYKKDEETMIYAAKETKDDHADSVTKAAVQLNMADAINSLRGLYIEELKYTVLNTLSSVTYVPLEDKQEDDGKK